MKSYSYTFKKGVINHNIPEDLIIDLDHINYQVRTKRIGFSDRTYLLIGDEDIEILKDNIMWSTENTGSDIDKGVLFIRHHGKVIATRIWKSIDFANKYYLCPIKELMPNMLLWCSWPYRPVKIFRTYNDFVKDKNKKSLKRMEKNNESQKITDKIDKSNPAFSLKTPKLRVVEVLAKTKKLEAKVGDVIQGELPVMERNEYGTISGCLYGGMSYSNYIICYVNGEKIKAISPLHFQSIFEANYLVEVVD